MSREVFEADVGLRNGGRRHDDDVPDALIDRMTI
jgi:hypothetical protein